jgi:tyrosyl-tRNA synthetase
VLELDEAEWQALSGTVPTIEVAAGAAGRDLVELLVATGVLASKGEGRRLIAQGGLYLNDVAVAEGRLLSDDDWCFGRYCMVRRGKKQRHLLLRTAA